MWQSISITARRLLATQPLGRPRLAARSTQPLGRPFRGHVSPSLGRPSPDELVVGALECSRPHLTPTSKWSLSRIRAPRKGCPTQGQRPCTRHVATFELPRVTPSNTRIPSAIGDKGRLKG